LVALVSQVVLFQEFKDSKLFEADAHQTHANLMKRKQEIKKDFQEELDRWKSIRLM
jgi:hypothetical protein